MQKLHIASALFSLIVLVSHVNSQCHQFCLKGRQTCENSVKTHPFEKLKRKKPCEGNGRKVYCCKSEEAYSKFNEELRLADLARSISGAEEHEYPHQVLFRGEKGQCGGTIYNKNWVITASHCVQIGKDIYAEAGGERTRVIAGLSDVRQPAKENMYEIAEIIMHEKWNPDKLSDGHDIALLRLAKPLKLEVGIIQPIRVEQDDKPLDPDSKAVIVGYGNVHPKLGLASKNLMEAEVPVHDFHRGVRLSLDPLNAEGEGGFVPLDQHAMVGGGDSGITVGQGDSGGPLICANEDNKPVLCGIASFKKCQKMKTCHKPNFYVRVAPFLKWIKKKTNNEPQEKEFLFDEPMFPEKVEKDNIPGYLVRIAGNKKSCSGVLIMNKKVVLTPADCIEANGGNAEFGKNTIIYHLATRKQLTPGGASNDDFERDISPNITAHLHRPLNKDDLRYIVLREPFEEGTFIQLPPKGFKLESVAVEYTTNEKTHSVEARRYVSMDREECQNEIHTIDKSLELDDQHLCMRQVYSAETECDRDLGGPLVCPDENGNDYLCGMKIFQGCRFSGFPQIFNNYMSGTLRKNVERNAPALGK